jgi:methylmalonyl-CoA/ethylmalonyl-CoA epimerase
MKTTNFSHIGIAVKDLDKALKMYTEDLGIDPKNIKTGGMPGVMRIANIMVGNDRIELLEFHDKKSNPIATIGEENRHALQHIGIYVDDVAEALDEFQAKGAKMLDKTPRSMPDGHKIGFVIPRDTEMLIELMQK